MSSSSPAKKNLRCPKCGATPCQVKESRASRKDNSIRRRRHCPNGHTFRTYEVLESDVLSPFDLNFIRRRLSAALTLLERRIGSDNAEAKETRAGDAGENGDPGGI